MAAATYTVRRSTMNGMVLDLFGSGGIRSTGASAWDVVRGTKVIATVNSRKEAVRMAENLRKGLTINGEPKKG